jgi:hypothetical protein
MTFLDDCAHAIAAEVYFLRGDELDDWHDHLEVSQPEQDNETVKPPQEA